MKKRPSATLFLSLILFSLALPGCGDNRGWKSSERIHAQGWAHTSNRLGSKPVYCYRTLGYNSCYSRPQPGREDQLEAFQSPEGPGYKTEKHD